MNVETIAKLEDEQIEAINVFLKAHNREVFSAEQIEFIKNLDESDVLGLAQGCAVVRGYFGDFSGRTNLGRNEEGLSAKQILDQYESQLDKGEYDPTDLAELLADQVKEVESEISLYGVILNTGKYAESEILFLSKDFSPLYLDYVRF